MANKLRLVITVNNGDLPDLLECLRVYADDVRVSLHEKDRTPKEPQLPRHTRKPRQPTPTTRKFIIDFAKENPDFSISKQLIPEGIRRGYRKNTLYSTCTRLAKIGVLGRNGEGQYHLAVAQPVAQEM